MSGDREIDNATAAQLAGVAYNTWTRYVHDGFAPQPVRRVGRTPLYDRGQVEEWVSNRRGPGKVHASRFRDGEVSGKDAARLAGIPYSTWRRRVADGVAPQPVRHIGRVAVFSKAAVEDWAGSLSE